MENELSELEAKFFQTGELPDALQPKQTENVSQQDLDGEVNTGTTIDNSRLEELLRDEHRKIQTQLEDVKLELAKQQLELNQPPLPPDQDDDPLGHLIHQVQTMGIQLAELQEELSRAQQSQVQQQQLNQFVNAVQAMRDDFVKTSPDYYEAVDFIRKMRTEELKAIGYHSDQIQQILAMDEIQVAQTAIGMNKNPAKALYEIAKVRGFKGGQQKSSIDQIKKGMQADSSLARGTTDKTLNLDSLKSLSDSDLDKVAQSDDLWAKVVGGNSGGKGIF